MRIAPGQHTLGTLAHELAHALAGVTHGHDASFRAAHVDVCALLADRAAAASLVAAYAQIGLTVGRRRWPPPVRACGRSASRVVP